MLAAAPTARSARAQSCWPVAVLLEVRDADGTRMDPAELDSVATLPADWRPGRDGRVPRAGVAPARVRVPYGPAPAHREPAYLLKWSQAGCRLRIDEVTLYRGGEAMRLDFSMVVDSGLRGDPSTFVIEAPPFQSASFRLRWDPMEPGGRGDAPQRLGAERWAPKDPP